MRTLEPAQVAAASRVTAVHNLDQLILSQTRGVFRCPTMTLKFR